MPQSGIEDAAAIMSIENYFLSLHPSISPYDSLSHSRFEYKSIHAVSSSDFDTKRNFYGTFWKETITYGDTLHISTVILFWNIIFYNNGPGISYFRYNCLSINFQVSW